MKKIFLMLCLLVLSLFLVSCGTGQAVATNSQIKEGMIYGSFYEVNKIIINPAAVPGTYTLSFSSPVNNMVNVALKDKDGKVVGSTTYDARTSVSRAKPLILQLNYVDLYIARPSPTYSIVVSVLHTALNGKTITLDSTVISDPTIIGPSSSGGGSGGGGSTVEISSSSTVKVGYNNAYYKVTNIQLASNCLVGNYSFQSYSSGATGRKIVLFKDSAKIMPEVSFTYDGNGMTSVSNPLNVFFPGYFNLTIGPKNGAQYTLKWLAAGYSTDFLNIYTSKLVVSKVCTPVAATCAAAGVSCPGNVVLPQITCGSGQTCINGACIKPACSSNADCPSNFTEKCVNGEYSFLNQSKICDIPGTAYAKCIAGSSSGGGGNTCPYGCNGNVCATAPTCIPIAATCAAAGVSCPGNMVLPKITCGSGQTCSNGACVSNPIIQNISLSCYDNESYPSNDTVGYVNGTYLYNGAVLKYYYEDQCTSVWNGTMGVSRLTEYFCLNSMTKGNMTVYCDCSGGKCI